MGFWCWALIVASVLFEVGGLGLVAWQLGRVQRREFGTPAWLARVQATWRRLTGRSVSHTVSVSGVAHARAIGSGSVSVRRGPGETIESRLTALEANLAALDSETGERFQQHSERQDRLQAMITEAQSELQRQQDEREGERREQLRESLAYQWIGTGLFFIGAVLAGVANGVC
jgi:hypothetical protein